MAKALGVVRTGGMAALILAWAAGGEVKLARGCQRLGRGRVLWTCLAAATAFTVYAAIGIYGILEIEHAA
jgi:hypothetical protein